jgi:transcriptional regulator GlxA family with amidase domain
VKKKTSATHPTVGRTQKRVVILAMPPIDALDVVGPADVFAFANSLYDREDAPYVLELVCSDANEHLENSTGFKLTAHRTLAQERLENKAIDTLIVAAGWEVMDRLDQAAITWIALQSDTVRRLCSISVGAFALAEAGLLEGRKATTHWQMTRSMAERYPNVQVDPDLIWVKDGNVYTSAGTSAGIDLALALVSEDLGDDVALDIAKNLLLFLRRPGGQTQFSVTTRSQDAPGTNLGELCKWIRGNLNSELSVEALACRLSTSIRTLLRLFQQELQTSPAKYVEDIRVEAACREIELGERSMSEVARRCGYHSVDVLRNVFVRRVGVSPTAYAQRFSRNSELT